MTVLVLLIILLVPYCLFLVVFLSLVQRLEARAAAIGMTLNNIHMICHVCHVLS